MAPKCKFNKYTLKNFDLSKIPSIWSEYGLVIMLIYISDKILVRGK